MISLRSQHGDAKLLYIIVCPSKVFMGITIVSCHPHGAEYRRNIRLWRSNLFVHENWGGGINIHFIKVIILINGGYT